MDSKTFCRAQISMTTPSHHPPGKESVIILLIVCPLSQSYRRIVVSVVFICRIESEPPVIVEQATLILTTLLAVIITIACLKETLLSPLFSLSRQRRSNNLLSPHIFSSGWLKGEDLSVRETRRSSSTTLFWGAAGYGQRSAVCLPRSGCASLARRWFTLSRLLDSGPGLGSARGSFRAGTKPSAQPHQQKGFLPEPASAESGAGASCLFTPAEYFHEAEIRSACSRAGERANPLAVAPGASAARAHASGCPVGHVPRGRHLGWRWESEAAGGEESRGGTGARKGGRKGRSS